MGRRGKLDTYGRGEKKKNRKKIKKIIYEDEDDDDEILFIFILKARPSFCASSAATVTGVSESPD